jgi:hypothetical protein
MARSLAFPTFDWLRGGILAIPFLEKATNTLERPSRLIGMSLVAGCALLTMAIGQGHPIDAKSPLLGDWVTIQATGAKGKELLHIAKDGSFTLKLSLPDQPDKLAKGHFVVKQEQPPGSKDSQDFTVYITPEIVDGKALALDSRPPERLGFYSKGPILTDTVAIVFCRPGDEKRITKMFGG